MSRSLQAQQLAEGDAAGFAPRLRGGQEQWVWLEGSGTRTVLGGVQLA